MHEKGKVLKNPTYTLQQPDLTYGGDGSCINLL